MWQVSYEDERNDRAMHRCRDYKTVAALVGRLLEHGRKIYGDKVTKIVITSGHKTLTGKDGA